MPNSRPPSAHARAFAREVGKAFAGVTGCISYLDTIQVMTSWMDGARVKAFLNAQSIQWLEFDNPHPRMSCSLLIQRPTRAVLERLQELLGRFELIRVDLAVDLLFGDSLAAEDGPAALQAFLAGHLTQRYHGKRRMGFAGKGVYWALPWKGRNIAIYSDRVSKLSGQPCTHVEFRFFSAKQVRKVGATRLVDLLEVDMHELLLKQCTLMSLSPSMMERNIDALVTKVMLACRPSKGARRVSAADRYGFADRGQFGRRVRSVLVRALADEGGQVPRSIYDVPIQIVLDHYRGLVGRAVARVPLALMPLV